MKITFLGAAGTVTGSQHLVEANGHRLLLDCGMFQGRRKESFERNRSGVCDGASIDAVVLSHAHIDHSGRIPCLVRRGFEGDIICTSATRDLCGAMLMDSAHIQESDVAYVNKKRRKEKKNLFEPLYTPEDVLETMNFFVGISYGRSREILPGIRVTLVDAGHLLGSASVIVDVKDRETGTEKRLVFSGDVGRPDIPILRDPEPVRDGADILIIESTYGNRFHPAAEETEAKLARIVNETSSRGGTLLIPAFAVGRTQQLAYTLHRLHNAGRIPEVPVYVDSPLATRVTDIFRLHPEVYDSEIRAFLLADDDQNPFGFESLRYVRSVSESKRLNGIKGPAVIISASGMMENGRILHHLIHRVHDPNTTILVVGWQAPHTLGRRILEREPMVRIFGEEYPLRANVEVMTALSGHADRKGLLEWAGAMKKKPSRTFVVHGEPEAATAFADGLEGELGFANVRVPGAGESFEV